MRAPRSFAILLATIAACTAGAAGRSPHARLDLLAQDAAENGHLSYGQIVRAFYGEDAESIIETKRAWRESHRGETWNSDYDLLLNVAVNVQVAPSGRVVKDDGSVIARYTLETNTAQIPRASAGAMLAHEVAHGLTRRSVRTTGQRAQIDDRLALDAPKPTGAFARQSGFHFEWLSYIATQVEFEVRLQALNRFHFEMTGRAIDSPVEALRAVVALGVDLDSDEVADLLALHAVEDPSSSARLVCTTPRRLWSTMPECFRNADDLRKALQMAAAWDPDIRRTLLEKIAMEAPGHF